MRKVIVKTVAALLAAVAGTVIALNAATVIVVSTRVLVTAIVVSTSLAALSTIGGAWTEWRARRLGARQDLVELQLTATMWAIVDSVGSAVDYRDLGMAWYRAQRCWWRPWTTRLRRLYRVRASRRPVTSTIRWWPGKGVVGFCVARGEVVAVDLAQMYADLGDPNRSEWDDLPEDVRLGLSYDEYLSVRDKYAVVVASPVIDDSGASAAVRGCVALDGPAGRFAELTTDEVLGLLNSAAQGLLRSLG